MNHTENPSVTQAGEHASGQPNTAFRAPPKLALVLGSLIALGLIVGVVPRWLEHRRAVSVEKALEVPVVSVVSPTVKKDGAGVDLPAEIRPWRRHLKMTNKNSTGWQNVRRLLSDWSKPALIALVKELYEVSPDSRDFLQARFQTEADDGAALEKHRRKIVDQFYPARGDGKLKLAEARKAIRDYQKATGNLAGGIDLMLTYVENGTESTREFGDINESFYNSLESVLNEMVGLLLRESPESYPRFRERIQWLATLADGIGWGYGDAVRDQVFCLEQKLGQKE